MKKKIFLKILNFKPKYTGKLKSPFCAGDLVTQTGELEICALCWRVGIYGWSLFIFSTGQCTALINLGTQGGSDLAAPLIFARHPGF